MTFFKEALEDALLQAGREKVSLTAIIVPSEDFFDAEESLFASGIRVIASNLQRGTFVCVPLMGESRLSPRAIQYVYKVKT